MNDNKTIVSKVIFLTDIVAQLDNLLQKLDLLSEDFCYNYLEHINLRSELEIKLVKTMAEIIRDYSNSSAQMSAQLPDLAENLLENIRCE